MRAALGLAVVLTLGFAADALVLVTTRAHADAASIPAIPSKDHRIALAGSLTRAVRPVRSDAWTLATIGLTLVLAVAGAVVATGRRFLLQGSSADMKVVGRVSLSPKHAVYMLRVGERVLLVGVGPQGAPALISELDETAELVPDLPQGEPS